MADICVLGAGVIGLSTAINIQRLISGSRVKIIASNFDENICSFGAAASFLPGLDNLGGNAIDTMRQWCESSWCHYDRLIASGESKAAGVNIAPCYVLDNKPIKRPLFADIVYTFRFMTAEEISKLIKISRLKYGILCTTIVIDMEKYLSWLTEQFKSNEGKIEFRTVTNPTELLGGCDVLVNCTGLGSRYLFNDNNVYPVRGQTVQVKAPWIKHSMKVEDSTYIYPRCDKIILGGTRQKNNFNKTINPDDTRGILKRCQEVCPALKGAEIINEWVGLRPTRDSIRVETEMMSVQDGLLKIVHNYGHGGNGVTLSWGTAEAAAKLVKQLLRPESKL